MFYYQQWVEKGKAILMTVPLVLPKILKILLEGKDINGTGPSPAGMIRHTVVQVQVPQIGREKITEGGKKGK